MKLELLILTYKQGLHLSFIRNLLSNVYTPPCLIQIHKCFLYGTQIRIQDLQSLYNLSRSLKNKVCNKYMCDINMLYYMQLFHLQPHTQFPCSIIHRSKHHLITEQLLFADKFDTIYISLRFMNRSIRLSDTGLKVRINSQLCVGEKCCSQPLNIDLS